MINNFAEMNPEFRIWFRRSIHSYSFALSTTSRRARAIADVIEHPHGRTLAVVASRVAGEIFEIVVRCAPDFFRKQLQKPSNGNRLACRNNFLFIRRFNEMSARRHQIFRETPAENRSIAK
jgi:hypothetical protein